VQEISPAVAHAQAARRRLRARLREEHEVAAVVEFPHDAALGKHGPIRERRAGRVLAETGGVGDERARRQAREQGVGILGAGDEMRFQRRRAGPRRVQRPEVREPRRHAIRDVEARGPARGAVAVGQVPRERGARAARAQDQRLGPAAPVRRLDLRGERVARGDGIDGAAVQAAAALEEAAHLAERACERIEFVEEIAARGEDRDLVRRHERADRVRVALDELDRGAVVRRRRAEREIHAAQRAGAEPEPLRPAREHAVDRRLRGRDADEIHRGLVRGREGGGHRRGGRQ
jgi:hypothetical protein